MAENLVHNCTYDGMLRESDLYVKNRIRKAVQSEQDRRFLRDANIVEYVQKMRETQSFILRLEATQFGLLPE